MSIPRQRFQITTNDPRVAPAAHARAAELGFCPGCVGLGQYVPTTPGRDTCLTHSRKRPESAVQPSGVPSPATQPAGPPRARTGPETARFCGALPRRRTARAGRPDGRYRAPHMVAVINSLPSGSRRARSQVAALRALDAVPGLLMLRGDRQATIAAVWRALVVRADYATQTVTVVWAELQAESGRSRATVARALAWLRGAGLLGVVHTGASAAVLGGDLNRAPTYVLAVPAGLPVDEIETPPGAFSSVGVPRGHARDEPPGQHDPAGPGGPLANPATTRAPRPTWKMSDVPVTAGDMLAAGELLRWEAVTLRPLSARMLRHLLRAWFAAGWSPRDVLHGLDHTPDGRPWRYAGMPRAVAAWARYRLGAWLDPAGRPRPSRSQVAAGSGSGQRRPAIGLTHPDPA